MAEALNPSAVPVSGEPSLGEPAAVDAEARVVEAEPLVVPAFGQPGSVHRRFGMAYIVLIALAVLAFTALGFVMVRAGDGDGPAWSPYEPTAQGLQRADQIAAFVSARYRLDQATPLVAVHADVPSYKDQLAAGYIVRGGQVGQPDEAHRAEGALQYELCGLGTDCAIAIGEPTAERERLVRREALELALYTFHYIDGVERVATFLPPRAGSAPTWVLLFEKDDFRDQLKHPIDRTLPDAVPAVDAMDGGQQQLVDRLTEPHRYQFAIETLQTGAPVFVLKPPVG